MTTTIGRAQIEVAVDASGVDVGVSRARRSLNDLADAATQAGTRGAQGVQAIGTGGDAAARRMDQSTRSLVSSIQRTTAAMEAGSRSGSDYFRVLANQRGVDLNVLQPYLAQLDAARVRQEALAASAAAATPNIRALAATMNGVSPAANAAATALNSVGMSARATSAAMRNVPAQFTDIITSLQGGQAPLTVLLQQGGQLKDMFGGVGNAARALGGYIAGLISPFTIAAAAVSLLGVAYYKGSEEAIAYSKALTLTGNAAAVTVGQLQDMATRVSATTGATVGASAEALAALAGSGRIAGEGFERFAAVAVKSLKLLDTPIADTVKQLEDLGESPVAASVKLNESTNYLTESIYKQIKALEDQGLKTRAAQVAQDAWASSTTARLAQIEGNLGSLQRGWYSVVGAAKSAWDAMLGVGRSTSPGEAIAAIDAKIKSAQDAAATQARTPTLQGFFASRENIAALEAQKSAMQEVVRLSGAKAAFDQASAGRVKALAEYDVQHAGYMSKAEKAEKEILATRNLMIAAGKTEQEIAAETALIRDRYKETGGGAKGAGGRVSKEASDYARLAESVQKYVLQLEAEIAGEAKLTESQKISIEAKRKLNAADQVMIAASLEKARSLEIALEMQKLMREAEEDAIKTMQARAEAMRTGAAAITEDARKIREHTAEIGLSKSAIDALKFSRDEDNLALLTHELALLDATGQCTAYSEALRDNIAALGDRANALRGDAIIQASADAAKKARDDWKETAKSIEQSLTDALLRGFEAGKDFAGNLRDTLVNMFKTLILRPVIQATLSTTGLSTASGAADAATTGGVTSALGGSGPIANALSTAKSAYDMITGGARDTYAYLAKSGIGQQLGLSSVNSGGLGVPSVAGGVLDSSSYSTTQLTTLGESVGAGLATVGAGLIGNAIGSAIAGDKRIISGISTSTVGAAVGALAGPIGALAGGAIGGLLDAAFGSGKKEVKASGISGTFSGSGFEGQSWDFWKKSGGWFGGGKKGTDYSPLDASTSTALSTSFSLLKLQTGAAAESLGVDTAQIAAYSKQIQIQLTEDATANSKSIADMLGGISDDLAQLALAGSNFGQAGETAAQTLTRLSSSLVAVNDGLSLIHLQALQVSLAGGDLASKLATASGGIDAFKTSVSTYYDAYFSDAEKQADLTKSLSDSFAAMNLSLPTSKEAFRSLIEGLDLTTESGQKTFAGMISLSGSFAQMTDAAAAAAKATDDVAKSMSDAIKATQARMREESGADRKAEVLYRRQAQEQDSKVAQIIGAAGDREQAVAGTVKAMIEASSANALQIANVLQSVSASAAGAISVNTISRQAESAMATAGITGVAANIVGVYVRKGITDALQERYAPTGPGIASVIGARNRLDEAISLPNTVNAANRALADLSRALDQGKIDAKGYAASVDAVNSAFGGSIPTAEEIERAQKYAAEALVSAGLQSLNLYFGKLGDSVSALADEAAKSSAPIAAATSAIGRLMSAYAVFGQSAQAAATLGAGGLDQPGISTTINGALVASAAKMAASVISTQSSADVQKQLSGNFTGASRRNASLLLDGISAYGSTAFEQGFQRISDALAKGVIGEEQYKELFDIAIKTYTGQTASAAAEQADESTAAYDAAMLAYNSAVDAAKKVTDAFADLRKTALSLSDSLTLDAQATPQATFAEATRQYLATVAGARTGDGEAVSNLGAAARAMLDAQKAQSGTALDYRLSVAQAAADMRALGGIDAPAQPFLAAPIKAEKGGQEVLNRIFTPTFANGGQSAESSQSVTDELKALREDLKAANAAIAVNTNNTAKILQRWTVNGMPAVAA